MIGHSRQNAFLLPLALLSLLVVSIITINGYLYIQNHISSLSQYEKSLEMESKQYQFEQLIFENKNIQNSKISSQIVPLSGFYNISFLTHTDVEGETRLVEEQFQILTRLIARCASVSNATIVANSISTYMVANAPTHKGFGLLDLFNELSLPLDVGIKLLPCLRIAPRSYSLNLKLASHITLNSYFDLNAADVAKLALYLAGGEIPNSDALKLYLSQLDKEKDFDALLRNTNFSTSIDHKALVLFENGETFGYLDAIKDARGLWEKNRSVFLWTPMD